MSRGSLRGQVKRTSVKVVTAAGNYTLINESVFVVNKASGAETGITLSASPAVGHEVLIVDGKGDAATNAITITPAAGNINGAGTYVISENYGSVALSYNGTQWNVVAAYKADATLTSAAITTLTTGTITESTVASGVTIDGGVIRDGQFLGVQSTPIAKTGVATISIADILTGIVTITQSTGATLALTLDTGAAMDIGKPASLGVDGFIDWTLINLSAAAADTATLTASAGHTIVGTLICQSAHSSIGGVNGNAIRFRSRRTAADTYVTYRLG